jgi:hypothetical protein
MRRALATGVALISLGLGSIGLTGCGTQAASSADPNPSPSAPASLHASGQKSTVCGAVRTKIANHMTALGSAMGTMIGSANGAAPTAEAAAPVSAEVRSLAADVAKAAAPANDAAIRMAAQNAASSIRALAMDPAFVPSIRTLADVATAIGKIGTAVQPLADACR